MGFQAHGRGRGRGTYCAVAYQQRALRRRRYCARAEKCDTKTTKKRKTTSPHFGIVVKRRNEKKKGEKETNTQNTRTRKEKPQGMEKHACILDVKYPCGDGRGLAVSEPLDLLVLTDVHKNAVLGFSLAHLYDQLAESTCGLRFLTAVVSVPEPLFVLGGKGSVSPMNFLFYGCSGFVAFVDADSEPLLLVTDSGNGVVHILNVLTKEHCGYIDEAHECGQLAGVAASGKGLRNIVAVASYQGNGVHIFDRTDVYTWTRRCVARSGCRTIGVRFCADGAQCVAAEHFISCVCWYSTVDGSLLKVRKVSSPLDVEVLDHDQYFVTSSCAESCVQFEATTGVQVLGTDTHDIPTALCLLPYVGILVRDYNNGHVCVYVTEETVRKITMSAVRNNWMAAVVRSIIMRNVSKQQR